MKALLPIVVVLLVCIVLFVAGIFSPRRSRRMQRRYSDLSKKTEGKSGDTAGPVGDITRTGLEKARHGADASARAGRRVNNELSRKAEGGTIRRDE